MIHCYARPKHKGASLAREEGERDDGLSSCKRMSSTLRWDIMQCENGQLKHTYELQSTFMTPMLMKRARCVPLLPMLNECGTTCTEDFMSSI